MTTADNIFNTLNGFGSNVKELITQAASLLGEAALHLYKVLVMHQVTIGIQNIVLFLLYLIGTLVTYIVYRRVSKKEIHYQDKYLIYGLLCVIAIYTITTAVHYLNVGIPYLINPEYYAIMEAKNIVQELK